MIASTMTMTTTTTDSNTDALSHTINDSHTPHKNKVPTVASITSIKTRNTNPQVWTRLNYKGIYHDNRRLLKHRAKNCECEICYREIYKLPPAETAKEYATAIQSKIIEREIKQAKKKAMKDIKSGRQRKIDSFFKG